MSAKNASQRAKTSPPRLAYRQGAKTVYVESLDNLWAIRYAASSKSAVKRALQPLGEIRELPGLRLFLVQLEADERQAAWRAFTEELLARGVIEFCRPVLRAARSQLHQILTDEISVRFKQVPSSKQLKAVEKKYGVKVARQNEFVPNQFVVKAPPAPASDTLEIASQLDAADEVEFAAPNFIAEFEREAAHRAL